MKKISVIVPVVLCIVISCQDKTVEIELKKIKAQQSTEELNKSILSKWLNEVNKDNYENLFDELWAENSQ